MTPGVYEGMPFADYLAIPALNSSALRMARKSMAHVRAALDGKISVESKATQFGSLVHCLTLEPDTFENVYIIDPGAAAFVTDKGDIPKNHRATKSFSEWAKVNAGKTIVTAEDVQRARNATAAVAANERASSLLALGNEGAQSEVVVVWEEIGGVLCKARADRLGNAICDLKTTADASVFEHSMGRYDYGVQAAFYQRGVKAATGRDLDFAIVAVESEEPHGVRAAPMASLDMVAMHELVERYLSDVRRCVLSETWPGYESPEAWELPSWATPDDLDVGDGTEAGEAAPW